MEMTPQQLQLNNDLPHTEEFQTLAEKVDNLSSGQQEIKATLKTEVESQESFKEYVQGEFNKGTEKFTKVESRMDEIEDKMEKGLKEIADNQKALATEIKDDKLEKMTKQFEKLQTEKEDDLKLKRAFLMGVIKSILVAVVGLTVTYVFYKIGLTPPK